MSAYFVQNLTSPIESALGIGLYFDSGSTAGALAEFRELHEPEPGDIICIIPLNLATVVEMQSPPPSPVGIDLAELELPEEGT